MYGFSDREDETDVLQISEGGLWERPDLVHIRCGGYGGGGTVSGTGRHGGAGRCQPGMEHYLQSGLADGNRRLRSVCHFPGKSGAEKIK